MYVNSGAVPGLKTHHEGYKSPANEILLKYYEEKKKLQSRQGEYSIQGQIKTKWSGYEVSVNQSVGTPL